MTKYFEGNCITLKENYENKGFLHPNDYYYEGDPQIGSEIVPLKPNDGKSYQLNEAHTEWLEY